MGKDDARKPTLMELSYLYLALPPAAAVLAAWFGWRAIRKSGEKIDRDYNDMVMHRERLGPDKSFATGSDPSRISGGYVFQYGDPSHPSPSAPKTKATG